MAYKRLGLVSVLAGEGLGLGLGFNVSCPSLHHSYVCNDGDKSVKYLRIVIRWRPILQHVCNVAYL